MPVTPDPLSVPLDAAGRTARAEVVRGPRERDGRWYWRVREEHQGRRQDVSAAVLMGGRWLTPGEAHRALILHAAQASPVPTVRLRTLGEVLGAWVAAVRTWRDLARVSRAVYEARAVFLSSDAELAALSTSQPERLGPSLEAARDRLLATHAPATVHHSLAALRRAWKWASAPGREYVVGQLPQVRVRMRATRRKAIGTPGEAAAILQHLGGWHEAAFRVVVAVGARTGEACALDRASIAELDAGWLVLNGKTGPRTVRLDPRGPAAAALRRELLQRPRLADCRPEGATTTFLAVFRRAVQKAGVSAELTPYAWRRRAAVSLRRAGVDVTERAAILGHGVDVHLSDYDIADRADVAAALARVDLERLPEGRVLDLSAHNPAHKPTGTSE